MKGRKRRAEDARGGMERERRSLFDEKHMQKGAGSAG